LSFKVIAVHDSIKSAVSLHIICRLLLSDHKTIPSAVVGSKILSKIHYIC